MTVPAQDGLITPNLPAALDEAQKYRKIAYLHTTKPKTDWQIHLDIGKLREL